VRIVIAPPYAAEDEYFNTLESFWSAGETFGIQEHDIIPNELTWENIEGCPNDWCAAPYPYLDRERQFGLGVVKFSAALIDRHRTMFDVIGEWYDAKHQPKHWCTLDAWIYQFLRAFGESRCQDHELVGHLGHPGKKSSAHGCFTIP
jgi:hypothetical protein